MKSYRKPELNRLSKQEATDRLQAAANAGNEQARRILDVAAQIGERGLGELPRSSQSSHSIAGNAGTPE